MSAEPVPCLSGVVSFASARWVNLVRGDQVVVLASAPGAERVGVSVYHARKSISYRECTPSEADNLVRHLVLLVFSHRPQSELE